MVIFLIATPSLKAINLKSSPKFDKSSEKLQIFGIKKFFDTGAANNYVRIIVAYAVVTICQEKATLQKNAKLVSNTFKYNFMKKFLGML